jgi:hypothetical protein
VYPLIVGSLNYQKAGIFVQMMQYNSSNAKHCKNSLLSGRILPLGQQSCITNLDVVQSIYQPVVEILCVSTTIICLRLSISFVLDLLRPYKLVET